MLGLGVGEKGIRGCRTDAFWLILVDDQPSRWGGLGCWSAFKIHGPEASTSSAITTYSRLYDRSTQVTNDNDILVQYKWHHLSILVSLFSSLYLSSPVNFMNSYPSLFSSSVLVLQCHLYIDVMKEENVPLITYPTSKMLNGHTPMHDIALNLCQVSLSHGLYSATTKVVRTISRNLESPLSNALWKKIKILLVHRFFLAGTLSYQWKQKQKGFTGLYSNNPWKPNAMGYSGPYAKQTMKVFDTSLNQMRKENIGPPPRR